MKISLKLLGANKTEIDLGNGTRVLFSYETPVAMIRDGRAFVTNQFYSVTTSKHINGWILANCGVVTYVSVDQECIDNALRVISVVNNNS